MKKLLVIILVWSAVNLNANEACLTSSSSIILRKQFDILNKGGIDEVIEGTSSIEQLQKLANNMIESVINNEKDTCQGPSENDFKRLCSDIALRKKVIGTATDTVEYMYEQRLWQLACAKMGVDDEETARNKIQSWWEKYKTKCTCNSLVFRVQDGNILKFSVVQSFPDFTETLVMNYKIDINFIDPADGKNLLDFINDEIYSLEKAGISQQSIEVYRVYRNSLIRLGAKPSK
jgi:hypothetical protein